MPDVFSKAKRSQVMSCIRARGNRDTELALATVFRQLRISGWRRHVEIRSKRGEGHEFRVKPDFVFPRLKIAVFVDGCFWHGCPVHRSTPQNNAAFWANKFLKNRARDLLVNRALREAGWRVIRIWEHQLTRRNVARLKSRLEAYFTVAPRRTVRGGLPLIRL